MADAVRFKAVVNQHQCEPFLGLCYGLGMSGCEELEQGQTTLFTCYFNTEEEANVAVDELDQYTLSVEAIEVIEDRDWNAKWRETIEPVKVSDSIWISPEWLEPPLKDGDHWIKIEPRMAFGTGHHETTRLCSQQVVNDRNGRKSLLDIGTGSGILAFIAEYAGYTDITGVEIDPDCTINLAENLEANNKDANINFVIGTVDQLDEDEKFDTVVMNMISSISAPLLGEAHKRLNERGMLIWSGLLVSEKEVCKQKAIDNGFKMIAEIAEGEWWSARFEVQNG